MATPEAYAGNHVRFYSKAVLHPLKTQEAGSPQYENKVYVQILKPGAKNSEINRPVKPEDKEIYALQWKAFEANEEQPQDGTPLEQWPGITPAEIATLKHHKVMTVEQLAAISEGQAQSMCREGARLRTKAKAYLEAATGPGKLSERLTALEERLEQALGAINERDDTIEALHSEIKSLKERKKPGRPPKAREDEAEAA